MIVRFSRDFTDHELELIATAIDGNKKRRKGAAPRKAKRAECVGFIHGAVIGSLEHHRRAGVLATPLPAAQLTQLARGEQLEDEDESPAAVQERLTAEHWTQTPAAREQVEQLSRGPLPTKPGLGRVLAEQREQLAEKIEKLTGAALREREADNEDRAHRGMITIEEERALLPGTDGDPRCLRRGCGALKSKHSRMRACPGARLKVGIFE